MCLFKSGNIFIGHFNLSLLVIIFVIIFSICVNNIFFLLFLPNISFIGQNDHTDICTAVLLNFLQPSVDIYKRFFICQIENDKNSISTFVISFGDGAISLLACGIPNLQSNGAFVDLKSSKSEIYTYGCHIIFLEIVVLKNMGLKINLRRI